MDRRLLTPVRTINVAGLNQNLTQLYQIIGEELTKLKFKRTTNMTKFPSAVIYQYGHPILNLFNPIDVLTPKGFNYFVVLESTAENELSFSVQNYNQSTSPEDLDGMYNSLFHRLVTTLPVEVSPWKQAAGTDKKFLTNPITFFKNKGFFKIL